MRQVRHVVISLIFLFFLVPFTFAQEYMIAPAPPLGDGSRQLFGQNHAYSVVFRGNGESVVSARILFTNASTTAMKSIVLRVPRVSPQDTVAYQVLRPGQPYDIYNWYGASSYQKTPVTFTGDTFTITLPQPVAPDSSGSILLYYRAFGYAKKDIVGAYRFTFETLQAQEPIQQLQVGLLTDSDLVLRGSKSQVNYRFEDMGMAAIGMTTEAAPMANSRMDSYYQQIGYGDIVKVASNLQALESYTVGGSYADAKIKLYVKEIAIGIGIVAIVVAILIWIIPKILKSQNAPTGGRSPSAGVIAVLGVSFVSSMLSIGYTALVMFVMRNLSSFVVYDVQMPVTMLVLIVSLGVYGLLLVVPGILLGMRFGIWYGVSAVGVSMIWLVLGLIIYMVMILSSPPDQPVFMPMMEARTAPPIAPDAPPVAQ